MCQKNEALLHPRRMSAAWWVAALAVALGVSSQAFAQAEKLPKAEKILDAYVEAIGGKAAFDKLQTCVSKGKFEVLKADISGPIVSYEARPAKSCVRLELGGFGTVTEGTDGKVAWEMSAAEGPRLLEGDARAVAVRNATFDFFPNWRKLFQKVECVGVESINDKPCYRVAATPRTGKPETFFFDQESHLLVRREMLLPTALGELPVSVSPGSYKRVSGILVAHRISILAMMHERVIELESVEYNVDLPPGCFEPPDEVKALLKKKTASVKAGEPESEPKQP
ncbi:MAG: DUF620 domain-containing protein [Planctomycetes bacterium]|nr:DUF620 domain-containing protein [Planctomycetota bacterium]